MDTVQYLSQIRRYEALIESKTIEIAQIQSMATNITVATDNERVQSSGDKDRVGKAVVKIIDRVDKLEKILDDFYKQRDIIIRQIEALDKTEEYQVLFNFYVGKQTLEKIAETTGYSRSSVKRIKNNGIRSFGDKYGHLYKNEMPIWLTDYEENEPT